MKHSLIIGAGPGLSASLARLFRDKGLTVDLAARSPTKLQELCAETGAFAHACDATSPEQVAALFESLDAAGRTPDLVVYNAGFYTRGPIAELDPEKVRQVILANAYGAFLCAQQATVRMQKAGEGVILFTGASAGVKGYPNSSPFAMGKFALRGLCQSLARELSPQNIHIAHLIIDGQIYAQHRPGFCDKERTLDPDAIAQTYWHIATQDKSAWTWEIELRPFNENF